MKTRAIGTLVGLVGLSICLMAPSVRADNFEVVVKYGGKLAKLPGNPPEEALQGQSMLNGNTEIYVIPNVGPAAGKKATYDPEPKVEDVIKPLQAGDMLDIIYNAPKPGAPIAITSVTVYKPVPGEDDPHAFIFDESFAHKVGQQDINVVTLEKYKQKAMLLVPTHNDGGDVEPDDAILGIAGKLQKGELVYAQMNGTGNGATIKLLAPWANHFTGKFVKFDPKVTVNSDNDTGPAVELTDSAGKAVTALIPGSVLGKRWVPNPIILGDARRLKPDANVDYITADSGDQRIWLVSISASKPVEKSGLSRNNSNGQ